jgi:DNA-binding GntR family transcriptional regulator
MLVHQESKMTETTTTRPVLREINDMTGSLAQRVYQSLKEAIMTLGLPPGTVLRKGEICSQLGVSRSPVSEALTRLASDGLVDVVPQSATRVSYFSMSEIREGAFLREALELAAVDKVARECTTGQLAQLTRSLRLQTLLVEDEDYAGFYEADEDLHHMIMAFTGYARVGTVAATAWLQVDRARQLLLPTPGRILETVEEHRAVVDAIRAGDPEGARRAMQHHLRKLIVKLEPLEHEQPALFRPLPV